jgi:hypothetical protein
LIQENPQLITHLFLVPELLTENNFKTSYKGKYCKEVIAQVRQSREMNTKKNGVQVLETQHQGYSHQLNMFSKLGLNPFKKSYFFFVLAIS